MHPLRVPHRKSRSIGRRLTWAGLCALAAMVSGCGYSTQPLHRSTVRTVYVDMFQSREFRRRIEMQLTEALRKEIDRSTPYKNAPREKADTILSGEVLEWRQATIARDFLLDLPRETAATITVRYRWEDMRTGEIIRDMPRFLTTITYIRPAGEDTYRGREDATNQLARKIVENMEESW